ncbi:MAG: FtsX-like permease family protein [Bacteroidetes bacterium]|nr:FtsX-like permease family protein [Bacteroidota bacterium]MBU1680620.1 FtsX-like permease family protein [Bacteroidota bacterium]MBU2508003.1 FtsX-like permease family protein [Bacteroidota bacterium]
MKLYSISLQSVRRKKTKSILLLIGLVLAVASVVTLVTVSENINASVATNLDEFGANIIVLPKIEQLAINYGGLSIGEVSYNNSQLNENDIIKISSIKNSRNISIISPKLLEVTTVDGKKNLIAGVNFKDELRLKKWWHLNGNTPNGGNQILIGSNVAFVRKISKNDSIKIKSEMFIVSGIIGNTGSQDDDLIFMDLSSAQRIFEKRSAISLIEMSALCYDCPIEEIVAQVSAAVPTANVTPIKQTVEAKMMAVHSFENFSIGVSLVILAISFLIVFVNVNASVNERTREIGILKSIGFRRVHILQVILFEYLIISLIAGLMGYIAGICSAKLVLPHLSMYSSDKLIVNYAVFWGAVFLSLLVSLTACVYPALKAAKLDPTVAFRYI